jgi:type II secretory pathway pseudopilin PulG
VKSVRTDHGYVLIILMMVVLVLAIGLTVAIPVYQTELQREKEAELIFRGRQYVEAVRLFQMKTPGTFPSSLRELEEKKLIRRLYKDPMTDSGEWNVVLPLGQPGQAGSEGTQGVLVAPESALPSIQNRAVLGVVSSSTQKSIKLYYDQDSYDKWLFYYGQDPEKPPKIVYYGREEKEEE